MWSDKTTAPSLIPCSKTKFELNRISKLVSHCANHIKTNFELRIFKEFSNVYDGLDRNLGIQQIQDPATEIIPGK